MREIKFRGWERELQTMVYDTELGGWIFEYNGNPVRAVNQTINEEDYFYDLMQYTGLKDKNGAEIYEGDILRRGDFPNEKPEFIVRFGQFTDSPDYYHEVDCLGWYVERVGENDKYNTSLVYVIDMLDGIVCGNIYENPKLLERK